MGTQHHPSQRADGKAQPTEPGHVAPVPNSEPQTLADLVDRVCSQIRSIADEADRACARARDRNDKPR
jgi:hypothetical protein